MEFTKKTSGSAEFEDYHSTAKIYDELRVPVGLDKALELASQRLGKEKKSLKLLDIGCGTGNYINALKDKVGSCTGLEFNESMLAAAKATHKGDDRVNLIQGSAAEEKSFETEVYDVVIMTLVFTPPLNGHASKSTSKCSEGAQTQMSILDIINDTRAGYTWILVQSSCTSRAGSSCF